MHTITSLLEKIERAKGLEFGSIFDNVLEMYKKVWLKGFLVILLIFIAAVAIAFALSLFGISSQSYGYYQEFDLMSFDSSFSENIVYDIPQTVLVSIISLAFFAAFYRMCKQLDLGENVNDDFFFFFKKEYLSKIVILGTINAAITLLTQFMCFIPFIYAFVPLSYFAVIFAYNPNLSEMEIVKASFALGNKKWLITFGTMLVSLLLGLLGILACGIGVLFTISIVYLPVFFIYKEVVGFENTNEIDLIGINDDLDC